MKQFKIFDADTLEAVGNYDENDVLIRDSERYRSITRKRTIRTSVMFLLLLLFGITIVGWISAYVKLYNEHEQYVAATEIEEQHVTIEQLAGKYLLCGQTPLDEDSIVYQFIVDCGAQHPDIIMAQFILESGHGTSTLARETNNCFGMKRVSRGAVTTQIGVTKSGYGIYRNWQSSVIDRVLWDFRVFGDRKVSREEYINKIGHIYAEDDSYIKKIERVINQNNIAEYDTKYNKDTTRANSVRV